MGEEKKERGRRRHAVEFKMEIAERMLAGENVAALTARQIEISDWRDTYLMFRDENGFYSGARYLPVPPRAGGLRRGSARI